jgi:(S)-ureidoglycine aminohydrolase
VGYPTDVLSSRAIIRPGKFAIIPPEGLVNNVIPGFENCRISIVMSPKVGASFAQYLVTMNEGGQNNTGFGGDGVETFVYCLNGEIVVKGYNENKSHKLTKGGYFYCPPNDRMCMENENSEPVTIILYKQRHDVVPGLEPWSVVGNSENIKEQIYDEMENVMIKDLLPTEIDFDMNMHILTFSSPGSHPFVETHVQEHGAYILSGEGLYNLDNEWIPVKKGDYIWFGPFVPQAVYSVGREPLSYVYSKDCNRDVKL